jgi:pimeloyl-ACP methyl ester carboxylesterase
MRSFVVCLMLGTAAVTSCGHSSTLSLYQPPSPLPHAAPGHLIAMEEVKGIPLHPPARVWRYLYHSTAVSGADRAMSGFALVPTATPPAGARPVYGWAHGTVGLADACAPSHDVRANLPPYGGQQIERGAVVVAPDYEGQGTPGTPPYAVSLSDAHSLLDAVRAAAQLPDVGAIGRVVLAGHSQGGAAVLMAGQVAPTYAPELHVNGVVALAPAPTLPDAVTAGLQSPYKGTIVMGAIGLTTAYPRLDLATFLTASALADVPSIKGDCVQTVVDRYRNVDAKTLFRADPSAVPAVRSALEANVPDRISATIPVLIATGTKDEQVPAGPLTTFIKRLCDHGAAISTKTYDASHDDVVTSAEADALSWITARFDQRPVQPTCR